MFSFCNNACPSSYEDVTLGCVLLSLECIFDPIADDVAVASAISFSRTHSRFPVTLAGDEAVAFVSERNIFPLG